MSLFDWFSDLFEICDGTSPTFHESIFTNDFEVNPASGLPMVDGIGSVDVAGNPYGFDSSHDTTWFDSSSTSFDNDW